jgi:nitric oxide reductase NorD protein
MSFIEKWFQRGFDLASKVHTSIQNDGSGIDLEKEQKRVTMLLRLLSGASINLNLAKTPELWINDLTVSLPQMFRPTATFTDNQALLIYAIAMISIRINLSEGSLPDDLDITTLEKLLVDEFPGCAEIISAVDRISIIQPDIRQRMFAKHTYQQTIVAKLTPQDNERNAGLPGSATIATAPQVTTIVLDEEQENPLLHSFEKIHTAEDYQSGNKQLQDAEDLTTEQRALEELLFSKVIRTNQTAKSYAQADLLLDQNLASLDEEAAKNPDIFLYPEWSYREAKHKQDWCQVIEDRASLQDPDFVLAESSQNQAKNLQRFLAAMLNLPRWKRGYAEGPEIDLDAVIRHYTTPLEFRDSNSRLFQRPFWATKDLAILILIDISLSSDSWVDNKRILDLEKEFMGILAAAFDGSTIVVEIAGFCSETRKWCKYQILKDFSVGWGTVLGKIGRLAPHGYTRLGPILRHGTKRLAAVPARKRAIFLLTDARPTDYDAYEGQYGISDVQKAIQEAKNLDVHTIGFIIGNKREKFHERIFGRGGYHYTLSTSTFLSYFRRRFVELMRG